MKNHESSRRRLVERKGKILGRVWLNARPGNRNQENNIGLSNAFLCPIGKHIVSNVEDKICLFLQGIQPNCARLAIASPTPWDISSA
jgi:hypothetical protein